MESAALLTIFEVNVSEYSRLHYVIMSWLCTCLMHVFVGLFFLRVAVLDVSAKSDNSYWWPAY